MPLYEYECPQDGRFELVRKFSDPPLTRCPTCGKKIEKVLSAPAIQFKGSGWYITDYARKSGDGKDAGKDGGKEAKKDAATPDKGSAKESAAKDSPAKDSTKSTTTTGGGEGKSSA